MKSLLRARVLVPAALMVLAVAAAIVFYVHHHTGQRADRSFDASVAQPAYTDRHPKVLFDEAHQNFHTTGGRYRPFVRLITNDGYEVTANKQAFSSALLSGYDILIIANAQGAGDDEQRASSAFTEAECDAVRAWVEAGGSLLLIADHYPMGSAAERLAQRFAVSFSNGSTEDPKQHDPQSSDTSQLLFTRENGLLADHAITRGRVAAEQVSRVMTFTGTSSAVPAEAVALLRLSETAVDLAPTVKMERKGGDTFTTVTYENPSPAAGRAQGLALEFGRGRVVVLGEAAMLTAQLTRDDKPFGMQVAGIDNRQFALNVMHWLSRLLN